MNRPLFPDANDRQANAPTATPWNEPADPADLRFVAGPYHRPNDRRVILLGDPLVETTLTRPSLRTYRRNFTIACTMFTLGSVLILFSSPWSKELIAPGSLSSHHAPLAANEKGDRCAACHAAANGSLASWITGFFSEEKRGLSQSELCLKCHERSIASQFALNPHNVDPAELAAFPQRLSAGSPSSFGHNWLISSVSANHEIACSTCHQEHHGGDKLTTLTDAQCQTCHSQKFASFEHGHPEFTNYPQNRRSRIAFDHASHFGKHFPEKGQTFDCNQCHVDDSYRNIKRLAPFEQACAQCHNDQVLDSVSDGLVLLSLPMLDMQAIEQAGLNVGTWPLSATGDFDGPLPPIMRVLLLADSEANEVLAVRGSEFDFFDLDAENENDVRDAVKLTWAIKRLIGGLAANGPRELTRRFEKVLGVTVSNDQLSRMISTLDHSVFILLQQAWLPNLATELNASVSQMQGIEREIRSTSSDVSFVGGTHPGNPRSDFSEPVLSAPSNHITESPFTVASYSKRQPLVDDDWLAVNPLTDLMRGQVSDDNGLMQDRVNQLIDGVLGGEEILGRISANEHNRVLFDNLNRSSGWYRNDGTLQISYRATGHADPCLKSWIEFTTRIPSLAERAELKPMMSKILSATGVGQCQSCHTVDRQLDDSLSTGLLKVNWTAEYRDPAIRGFTKFSHAPHLVHAELKDCSKCHELDPQRTNAHSFVSFDQREVVSNFRPIVKSDCLQCHQPGRTNSSCMTCHHYHVEKLRCPSD
jgi:hypothetical protein